MPEVIFTGPAGRIEGRYHPARIKHAPIAIVLHPHPQFGGSMNHQIVYQLYYAFVHRGFSVLRFNFRGVGRSQGSFDHGVGELSDSASAMQYGRLQEHLKCVVQHDQDACHARPRSEGPLKRSMLMTSESSAFLRSK